MKIRAGFVTNSSSTSFLIIAKEELNEADFFELMGIEPSSPVADLFKHFYQDVVRSATKVDFRTADKSASVETLLRIERKGLSKRMEEKINEAKRDGLKAYYGELDSETDNIQTFFCTDSFEAENEKIYFNGLECVW